MALSIEWLKKQREKDEALAREIAERSRIRAATIRQAIKESCRELRMQIGRIAEEEGLIVVDNETPQLAMSTDDIRQMFVRAAKRHGLQRGVVSDEVFASDNGHMVGFGESPDGAVLSGSQRVE